jgi:outer membrane protein
MVRYFALFVALGLAAALGAQSEAWSLQRCIEYAQDNNLTIQQAELTARNAELTLQQNRMNRLPNVSGTASAGYQFGRTIDPTTNAFNNSRIGFNSYSVGGSVVLFGGNRLNSLVEQSKYDTEASQLDAADTRQNTALNIATAYLNILLAEEQVRNTQTQLKLSGEQLERTNRLIDAGQLAPNARLDLQAQQARNEQLLIEAQNAVDQSYLVLKQLLQLDPGQPLQIQRPEFEVEDGTLVRDFDVEEVYLAALQTQPSVQAAQLRMQSNAVQEQVAKAGYYPQLTLFGNLNTNYSSVNPDINNPNTENAMRVQDDPITVNIDGTDIDVAFYSIEGVTFPTKTYADQLNENFGQSVGLSLNVPIYSNHRNRINTQRARIGALNAELQSRQVKDLLKTNVQTAVTNFRAARNTYLAAQRSFQAAEAAYSDAQRRFDLGAINTFDYNNATDNLDIARRDLTRAKFQLLFNLKVVEFYLGQSLDL